MKGKKANSDVNWILGVFIYFLVFITIVSGLVSSVNQNSYNSSIQDADFSAFNSDYICDNPRFKYDINGEISTYSGVGRDRLFCQESRGALGKDQCNEVSGCSWENDTKLDWGAVVKFCFLGGDCSQEYFYCNGTIDALDYDVGIRYVSVYSQPRVDYHEVTFGVWSEAQQILSFREPSPCTHPNVLFNKTRCEIFSCSWEEYDMGEELASTSSVRMAFNQMFGFEAPFGFEEDRTFGFIIQGFFIWLPFFIFILAFVRLIRG